MHSDGFEHQCAAVSPRETPPGKPEASSLLGPLALIERDPRCLVGKNVGVIGVAPQVELALGVDQQYVVLIALPLLEDVLLATGVRLDPGGVVVALERP